MARTHNCDSIRKLIEAEMDTDDYLSWDLMIDILGIEGASDFKSQYDLEFDEDEKILWSDILDSDSFLEMYDDDDFLGLVSAYFDVPIEV